jgi:hypothetical protein
MLIIRNNDFLLRKEVLRNALLRVYIVLGITQRGPSLEVPVGGLA